MERFRISSVAKSLGVSTTTIYKHLKRLQTRVKVDVQKEGGITYLTEGGVSLLREAMTAAQEIIQPIPATPPAPIAVDNTARMDQLEKSMMLMADEVANQRKTIALQSEEIANQKKELCVIKERSELQVLLLNAPPKPVKAWEPVRVQPVLMPWYERLWLQVFSPESLRREAVE